MIKSKHNAFGFWLMFSAFIFFSFLALAAFSQFELDIIIIKFSTSGKHPFKSAIIPTSIAALLFYFLFTNNCYQIVINTNQPKSITFKSFLFGRTKTFFFSGLDGYVITRTRHESMLLSFETIRFVIDNATLWRQIDSWYYSNYEELKEAITELPYLGEVKRPWGL